jgi:hypothetical protein
MHEIQKILLKRLLIQNRQKYSVLTVGYDFDDNVVFHLKQLINKGLVKKDADKYLITVEGIKVITDYDLPTIEDTGYKTFFIGFLCNFGNEFLIKEHPTETTNFYNLPSGKPRFGEAIGDSLIRTFEANTGISLDESNFEFQSLHLKTIKTSQGEVLFDDAFTIYRVDVSQEQKEKMKLHNQVSWKSVGEIQKLSNRWPEIDICILKKDTSHYLSYKVKSDYILG